MLQDLEEGKLQNIDFLSMSDGNTEVTLNSQWMQHLQVSLHVLSGGSCSRVRLACQQQLCIATLFPVTVADITASASAYLFKDGFGCCWVKFLLLTCMRSPTKMQAECLPDF